LSAVVKDDREVAELSGGKIHFLAFGLFGIVNVEPARTEIPTMFGGAEPGMSTGFIGP
jgi:hypothetical protein